MSADNYTQCPRCAAVELKKKLADRKRAEEAYGNVTLAEYRDLLKIADQPMESVENMDLEEYIECGIVNHHVTDKPTFVVNFGAGCRKCKFNFTFQHSEELPPQ